MGNLLKIFGILAIVALIVCFILAILGMIGAVNLGGGCFYRYSDDAGGGNVDRITNNIVLNATANYKHTSTLSKEGTMTLVDDPTSYGQWLNTNVMAVPGQKVQLTVTGDVSLCRAFIPENNLQSMSNLDATGAKIPIPRIDENNDPILLVMDAKNAKWANLVQLVDGDKFVVSIIKDFKSTSGSTTASIKNPFTGKVVSADCSAGKSDYNPICGRYSIYSGSYVSDCEYRENYYNARFKEADSWSFLNPVRDFFGQGDGTCDRGSGWVRVKSSAPEPYREDGYYTYKTPYSDISQLIRNLNPECSKNEDVPVTDECSEGAIIDRSEKDKDYIMSSQYRDNRAFWFSADMCTGLLFRMSQSLNNSSPEAVGTDYTIAKISQDQTQYTQYGGLHKILDITATTSGYLQFILFSNGDSANNTGGYVLGIKATSCSGKNGKTVNDPRFPRRGEVQYMILPLDQDPNNKGSSFAASSLNIDDKSNGVITSSSGGVIWMRILNNQDDYKDSIGSYRVEFKTSQKVGSFALNILDPLMKTLKEKVASAGKMVFKNMTCYGGDPNREAGATSCTNFFTYIQGMITIYIMLYGFTFMLGITKITHKDLVTRIIKVAIISGLMNGKTFDLFNNLIFDFIMNFSDEVIANMSGYSLFSSQGSISNPFMFLDAVLSKVFFSKAFIAQIMALLSLGIGGIVYFIIVFVALMVLIVTLMRAMAVYIMAFMAVAILIGIAPLFLTFMLFDTTRYLFDNWVKFTIKYMLEPLILLAGIIILTQLFTIYLDIIIGYSVCWKCTLPIRMPFLGVISFLPIELNKVPLFCINWFGPWGMDAGSTIGMNMQHMVALIMIAYGMYGWTELSGSIVTRITATMAPSATSMGSSMASSLGQAALKSQGLDQGTRSEVSKAQDGRTKQRKENVESNNNDISKSSPEKSKPDTKVR